MWLIAHAVFHLWEVAVGICSPSAIPRDFPAVTLPAIIGVVLTPTASLYSALCLTPFSVRQIGPVIAPLYPDHKLEDLLKRIRMQG